MVLGIHIKNQNERIMFQIDNTIITLSIRAIRYGRTHLTVQKILFKKDN